MLPKGAKIMADFNKSMYILMRLEFSHPENALAYNKTENGYTYMGIYQVAWPKWIGWMIVNEYLKKNHDIKTASRELYKNDTLTRLVYLFYKKNFWDVARLDDVNSQKIADEIFIFGVNAGMKEAIKEGQRLVGANNDGFVGEKTLEAWNKFDEHVFDKQYDLLEQQYYSNIIARHPEKKIYANGWRNRSIVV